MRKTFLLLIFSAAISESYPQCMVPNGEPDTLFPVINNYCLDYTPDIGMSRLTETSVFRMQKRDSSLFIAGYFTHIVSNYGKGILVDENSQSIITQRKWKINGEVRAAIPDGQGGYYIAGAFGMVGDSVRRYIAQIDGQGRPTPWKLDVDSIVNALYKRNDTLFLGGVFSSMKNKARVSFGVYSISGDSVLPQAVVFPATTHHVNVLKAYNDTLIIAGNGITKFNMKTLGMIPWALPISLELWNVQCLEISVPNRTLFFGNQTSQMTALDLYTGLVRYHVQLKNHTAPLQQDYGKANSLLAIGDRLYIGGYFNEVYINTVRTIRKGLCIIDIRNGSLINNDFALDNHVTNLFIVNDKFYVSGFFTTISGSAREHFAELDTATLAVSAWNPVPSDPVRCFIKSNGKIFFGGLLSGLNAVRRNQLAEINIYTRELKPFSMPPTLIRTVERFFVKDSNLYLLCSGSALSPSERRLIVVNMNTKTINQLSTSFNTPTDIALDDMYLYASMGNRLIRYGANTLQQDPAWGINNSILLGNYAFRYILPRGNKIYCLANYANSPVVEDFANIVVVDKSTSAILHDWRYRSQPLAPLLYPEIFYLGGFDRDSIIYIRGSFTNLENSGKTNFVAISANTGAILNWNPGPQPGGMPINDVITSPIRYNDHVVWMGSPYSPFYYPPEREGLHLLDSATGVRLPSFAKFRHGEIHGIGFLSCVTDMLFTTDHTYITGRYDYVNDRPFTGIMRMGFQNGSLPAGGISPVTGPDMIVPNATQMKYYISNGNTALYSYSWTYTGTGVTIKNNGSDTVYLDISANATPGILKVRPQNYCGLGSEAQLSLSVGTVDLTIQSASVSSSTIGTGSLFNISYIENNTGTHAAAPNKVSFYLSPDNILTPGISGDLLFALDTITTSIAGGANSGPRSKQLTMPCNTAAGNYYIFWVADGPQEVAETNEINNTASVPITVNTVQTIPSTPTVTSTPNITVCAPNTITITANSGGCTSCNYTWNTGAAGNSITVSSSGTYTVTASNVCGITTGFTSVTINPAVVPSITINYTGCPDDSLIFQATAVNGGTNPLIQWYVNNVLRGTGQNFTLNNATNGTQVYAKLTSNAPCPNPATVNSAVATVNCVVTAIPNIDGLEEFKIMPNPSRGIFNVRLKLALGKKVSFDIKDILGNRVYYSSPVLVAGSFNKTIDMTHLSKGIYLLITQVGINSITEKIVIQ